MIDTTLEDAAAMAVSCNFDTVGCNSIVNELDRMSEKAMRDRGATDLIVLGSQLVQALLNDMVAVQILDQGYNMKTEREDD